MTTDSLRAEQGRGTGETVPTSLPVPHSPHANTVRDDVTTGIMLGLIVAITVIATAIA